MAFKYTGDMQTKPVGHIPAAPEDWRAMTDFSLTVKNISLLENLAKIESGDGAQQHGIFHLVSKKHIVLPGGGLYVLNYSAIKATANMKKLRQLKEMVFVAGNSVRSISFFLYSGNQLSGMEKMKNKMFMDLFSSFQFL
ncbi:hypothetical protein RI103_00275 [Paraburkholderia sp. FT54]|uniref:hypothetical protein n=1 Tax=Paraburkholderia sp. FT54 TaxID=3074437 RepID=UPI0028778693|nr:hypothetical protein [Paraburkholderia sp. FT54]WNC89833.1 hypothetical protein RI103_00275 [Paraburkholderia sp. FT54]